MKNLLSNLWITGIITSLVLPACQGGSPAVVQSTQPVFAASAPGNTAIPSPEPTSTMTPIQSLPPGAFYSGQYRNLFQELLGKSELEIQAKLDAAWKQLFYGHADFQRIYYPVDPDMAYIKDIGNEDVRSEGMSYGMMIAVQLDKQEEFNRLWKWAKTYMYQAEGAYQGYFAWHCRDNGEQLDANPASDGEEWFGMALFFAAARWGSGEGIFNYRAEANDILRTMLHREEMGGDLATNMFDADVHQVVFVPTIGRDSAFTDPSYHLPAFYELWSRWADQDREFWSQAAQTSRQFWKNAANPQTGLMPDYANFDGSPYEGDSFHKDFRFDAFRNASNVGLDYAWFAADAWQIEQSNRLLEFFHSKGIDEYPNQYTLDGTPLSTDRSPGLVAMNATAALASTTRLAPEFVQRLWDLEIPEGKWRYYDGLLYMLAFLQVSGSFRIYSP